MTEERHLAHLEDLLRLAESGGWPEWCARLHHDALNDRLGTTFEDERIRSLQYAGFAAAVEIDLLSRRPSIGFIELLDRLTGKIEVKQWIRELLQNALDVRREGQCLDIKLTLDEDSLSWTHNGRPFSGPQSIAVPRGEMDSLIEPGLTTKKAHFAAEGRFGVGFKAWSTFFKDVEVVCEADGVQVAVGWSIDTDRLNARRMEYSAVRERHDPETRFRFERWRPGHRPRPDDLGVLRDELSNMLRTCDHPVSVVILADSHEYRIQHACTRQLIGSPQGRPRRWKLQVHHEVEGEGTTETEEILAIQTEIIQSDPRINHLKWAVTSFIESEKSRYEHSDTPATNPWVDVVEDDWFDALRLTVGIIVSRKSDVASEHFWLHSLAPVERAMMWPTSRLTSTGYWHVNGPFFLDTDRLKLNSDHAQANTELLAYALRRCAHLLAQAALHHDPKTTALLYRNSPWDPLITDQVSDLNRMPYHRLVWAWRGAPQLALYEDVFPDGFFVGPEGRIIEPERVRRLPADYVLDQEASAKPLIDWLNDHEPHERCAEWDDLPWDLGGESPRLLRETDAPLLKLVKRLEPVELYGRLRAAGLLHDLTAQYPQVRGAEWFQPPLPTGARAVVLGEPPLLSTLVNFLRKLSESAGVRWTTDAEILDAYGQLASEHWQEVRNTPVVSPPMETSEAWWTNRLVEILGQLDALSEEDIQQIGPQLNSAETDWFAARGALLSEDDEELCEQSCWVLVRRRFSRPNWSLATETLTSWAFRKPIRGVGHRLWRPSDASRSLIDDSKGNKPNVLTPKTIETDKLLTVLAGSGVNPAKLVDMIRDRIEADLVDGAGGGMLLIANPEPASVELIDEIRGSSWSLLPNLLLTRKVSGIVNQRGRLGAQHQYRSLGNWRLDDRDSLCGHGLMLHDSTWAPERYEVLLRDVNITDYSKSVEAGPRGPTRASMAVMASVNSERLSRSDGLRLELITVFKKSNVDPFRIRRALIRRIGDKLSEHKNPELWLQPDEDVFKEFREEQLIGFVDGSFRLPPWLLEPHSPHLATLFAPEPGEPEIVVLEEEDLSVGKLPEGRARSSLTEGLALLLERFVAAGCSETLDLAWYLDCISRLFDEKPDPNVPGMLKSLKTITPDTREALEDAASRQLLHARPDDKRVLEQLKDGLQLVRGHKWESLQPVLEATESPDEQWQLFCDQRLVPPRSTYRYQGRDEAFHTSASSRLKPSMVFIGVTDAQRLLGLRLQSERMQPAGGWTIPQESGPLVLIPDVLSSMLEAEGAREKTIGRWDPAGLQGRLPSTLEVSTLEPGPWSFAQILIGLWLWKHQPDSSLPLPALVKGNGSDRCEIFEPDGPIITLGRRGWDLRCRADRVELVTAMLAEPHSLSRGSLRRLLEGLGLGRLKDKSLREERDVEDIALALELDPSKVLEELRRLRANLAWNPFHKQEDEEWSKEFLKPPDLHEEIVACLTLEGARDHLQRYRDALLGLLNRGETGPNRNNDLQAQATSMTMDAIEDELYGNIQSLVVDEPNIQVPGEDGPGHRYKQQRHLASSARDLVRAAELQYFPGNTLLLSPFTQSRARRPVGGGGLVPAIDRSVSQAVEALLDSGQWGDRSSLWVLLRDVMMIGEDKTPVSLRVHKFHAVLMAALDQALDLVQSS